MQRAVMIMSKIKQAIYITIIAILFILLAFTAGADDFIYVVGLYVLFTGKMVLDALD